jgi:hypothetical protein
MKNRTVHSSGLDSAQGLGRLAWPSGKIGPISPVVAHPTHRPWSPRGGEVAWLAPVGKWLPWGEVTGKSTGEVRDTRRARVGESGLTEALRRR